MQGSNIQSRSFSQMCKNMYYHLHPHKTACRVHIWCVCLYFDILHAQVHPLMWHIAGICACKILQGMHATTCNQKGIDTCTYRNQKHMKTDMQTVTQTTATKTICMFAYTPWHAYSKYIHVFFDYVWTYKVMQKHLKLS